MADRLYPQFTNDRANAVALAIAWGYMGLVLLALIF
jgi:hypothetical protein